MAVQDLVHAYVARGRHFYMLYPTAPALFEFALSKRDWLDLSFDRLGQLWDADLQDGWSEEVMGNRPGSSLLKKRPMRG